MAQPPRVVGDHSGRPCVTLVSCYTWLKIGSSAPAVELHDNLAATVVVDELELADVPCDRCVQSLRLWQVVRRDICSRALALMTQSASGGRLMGRGRGNEQQHDEAAFLPETPTTTYHAAA